MAASLQLISGHPSMLYSSSSSHLLVHEDQNQNHNYASYNLPTTSFCNQLPFEVSDYTAVGEGLYDESPQMVASELENLSFPPEETGESGGSSPADSSVLSQSSIKRPTIGGGCRIGFRTKSEVDILDDGYKWRKYGKKSVKNSPNPRNYYRCSSEGCSVKKRVERDGTDSSYVITTYDGVHSHPAPGSVCYAPYPNTSYWTPSVQQQFFLP